MKNKILISLVILLSVFSCKKDKEELVPEGPETEIKAYPDYSKLKVGNYWIYQHFKVDSFGSSTPTAIYDSCYVESDTIIRKRRFYKLFKPTIPSGISDYTFIRDSLHYLVDHEGNILFSSQDFRSTFFSDYIIASENDTVAFVSRKMDDKNLDFTTPAGTFVTSNSKLTYKMYPNWTHAGNPRFMHARYSENIGLVSETLPFYASNPYYMERRLVRYRVD